MNLKDKLHSVVYTKQKTDWKIKHDPNTPLISALKQIGEIDNGDILLTTVFTESGDSLFSNELLERKETQYLLSPSELLELKKRWMEEAWDASGRYSHDYFNPGGWEVLNAPDKTQYINSITLD